MAGEVLEATPDWGGLYHPSFPDHWTRCSLHSLARWVNGIAFKDIQFTTAGKPVIKIVEIKGGISGQTKFTQQNFDEAVCVRPGDLLFAWSGQPETSVDAYWWRGPEGWLNQHVFRVSPLDEIASVFFYYLLRYLKPNFVGIARNKQTTGLGHVTKRDMENLEVAYPSLTEQRAIAHILGRLDDKIELNRRMNETLEAMARALFKDWFVDFGPTRAKAESRDPYLAPEIWDQFSDKLDQDGKPEGWEDGKVEDYLELAYGKSLPARSRRPGGVAVYGSGGITGFHDEALIKGPAIIVGRKGAVGSLYWEDRPVFPIDTVFYVVPKRAALSFCYQLLLSQPLVHMNTDAAVPGLNGNNVYRLEFPWPGSRLTNTFESFASPLWKKRTANIREIDTLSHSRDLLLPKLMSGEVPVGDADKIVKELT